EVSEFAGPSGPEGRGRLRPGRCFVPGWELFLLLMATVWGLGGGGWFAGQAASPAARPGPRPGLWGLDLRTLPWWLAPGPCWSRPWSPRFERPRAKPSATTSGSSSTLVAAGRISAVATSVSSCRRPRHLPGPSGGRGPASCTIHLAGLGHEPGP